jgi:hypothetical protein
VSQHMTIDSNLAEASVASMVWDFRGIITGSVDGMTLPTKEGIIGGSSVRLIAEPEASEMLAAFQTETVSVDRSLTLEVLNGSSRNGAAGEMSDRLQGLGFEVASVGNAGSNGYGQTIVIVPAGSDDGDAIVSALGFGVVEFGSVDNGYDAVVIVGSDAS